MYETSPNILFGVKGNGKQCVPTNELKARGVRPAQYVC